MRRVALVALLYVVSGFSRTIDVRLKADTTHDQQVPPVFRSTADLVEVDVVVRDKSGRFVTDLSLADFTVEDQGAPQTIEQLYLHLTTSNGWPVESATRQGVPSALPASSAAARRTFVVFFDDAHMTAGGFKRTQAAAAALFSKHFRTGDVGGVVIGNRMANNRLTTDREELIKAVRNAKPSFKGSSRVFDEQQWPRMTTIEAVRVVVNNDQAVFGEAIRRACAEDQTLCQTADVSCARRRRSSPTRRAR